MKSDINYYFTSFKLSGINFKIFATPKGIRQIHLNNKKITPKIYKATSLQPDDPYLFNIFDQLEEYFNSKRKKFDFPIDLEGTDFQFKVWKELQKIPYGKVKSYREIAEKVGGKTFVRAVGRANGQNPLPIIIPCHRVVESSGRLGGYSGGIEIKIKLLELEGNLSLDLFQ